MVSVSLVLRDNLINKAKDARSEYESAAASESESLNTFESTVDNIINELKGTSNSGSSDEAKKIAEAMTNYLIANGNDDTTGMNAAAEELKKYGAESFVMIGTDIMNFYNNWICYNSTNVNEESYYYYLLKKGYLYKAYDGVGEFTYVEPGTDKENEAFLTNILGFKAYLENKIVGQKVADMKAKYEANELKEYILEGYDADIQKIDFYDGSEVDVIHIGMCMSDLTWIMILAEGGETFTSVGATALGY